jgi:poly-beta-hydroxybutyrate-responsive repressor
MCEECSTTSIKDTMPNLTELNEKTCECPTGLSGKYIQPCLLLVLIQKDSYGYELMEEVRKLGATPDASAVYRMLRRMEGEGLVGSQWFTEGPGPAKRFYKITPEGEDLLNSWVAVLNSHKESLEQFLDVYNRKFEKGAK